MTYLNFNKKEARKRLNALVELEMNEMNNGGLLKINEGLIIPLSSVIEITPIVQYVKYGDDGEPVTYSENADEVIRHKERFERREVAIVTYKKLKVEYAETGVVNYLATNEAEMSIEDYRKLLASLSITM